MLVGETRSRADPSGMATLAGGGLGATPRAGALDVRPTRATARRSGVEASQRLLTSHRARSALATAVTRNTTSTAHHGGWTLRYSNSENCRRTNRSPTLGPSQSTSPIRFSSPWASTKSRAASFSSSCFDHENTWHHWTRSSRSTPIVTTNSFLLPPFQ